MSCEQIREEFPEIASGVTEAKLEVQAHLKTCHQCAEVLEGMQKTMLLLDEWVAPEPSPFFDVRLQAHLREERQKKQQVGRFAWLRRPAMAIAAVALLAVGAGLLPMRGGGENLGKKPQIMAVQQQGTAVGDLQFLDKHSDLLQDFEALDAGDDDAQQAN